MAIVEKSVLIERSAEQMFDLVESIEDYPKFLPWCAKTEVDYRDAVRTVATLHISYLSVRSHFTTENGKDYPRTMSMRLVDGPFRRLEGQWTFKALSEEACKIEFRLAYEFSSKNVRESDRPRLRPDCRYFRRRIRSPRRCGLWGKAR